MNTFNGREMNEMEERLHKDSRCIACGIRVKERRIGWIPLECDDCFRVRNSGVGGTMACQDFGASWASMHHEYSKRLGYGTVALSTPWPGRKE